MMMKYIVRLSDEERQACGDVVNKLKGSSQKVRRAQILLKADADGPAWTDARIAEAFNCRGQTIGGLAGARRVADAMTNRITVMNAGQGFTGNIVTAFLVTCASRWGMPVSTTHVSCGALFGIGIANRQAHWKFIRTILAAWLHASRGSFFTPGQHIVS